MSSSAVRQADKVTRVVCHVGPTGAPYDTASRNFRECHAPCLANNMPNMVGTIKHASLLCTTANMLTTRTRSKVFVRSTENTMSAVELSSHTEPVSAVCPEQHTCANTLPMLSAEKCPVLKMLVV